MRGKCSFLCVDIWFDLTKCKFIVKNSSFKMLVVPLPIFVVDTKIIFVYNFVVPLTFYDSTELEEYTDVFKLQKLDSLSRQKMDDCFLCFFQLILRQNVSWFSSCHRKMLIRRGCQQKEDRLFYKTILGIFKIGSCSRDQHIFM